MVCPACGGDHSSEGCPQTGIADLLTLPLTEPELSLDQAAPESLPRSKADSGLSPAQPASRLITFPGVTRRTVPPWRKELSERVRELQERRAHEAAAEAEATGRQLTAQGIIPPPQLELLPPAESLPPNPLVAAALARIERAHQPVALESRQSYPMSVSAAAGATDARSARTTVTTVTMDSRGDQPAETSSLFNDRITASHSSEIESTTTNYAATEAAKPAQDSIPLSEPEEPAAEPLPSPERATNIAMVQPPSVVAAPSAEPEPMASEKPKAKRVISDDSTDPALNYLDKIGVKHSINAEPTKRAPVFRRLLAGLIDILGVCFLSVPFAALIELRNDNWREPRIAGLMAGAVIVVMFIYLTVSTALTGRTLGLKILSLRVIDARTGLIPTGTQAASRAIVYILSLATAGLGFLMALARDEGRTVHDRLSGTAVVRIR